MHHWKFILAAVNSPTSHTDVGELVGATERTVTRTLSGTSTAGCRIPIENAAETGCLLPLLTADTVLRCYREDRLMFNGPVQSVELQATDTSTQPSLAVTAADPSINLVKRLGGKSAAGTAFTTTGRIAIMEALMSTANGEGVTGLRATGNAAGTTVTYTAGPYKPLAEILKELSVGTGSINGFDWYVSPIEPAAGYLGEFRAAGTIGARRSESVFEYQGRANMRAPVFQRTWDSLANVVYHIHPSGPQITDGVLSASDTASIAYRGRYEAVAEGDLSATDLRNQLLNSHLLYRKGPRHILSFQPEFEDGVGPEWAIDYDLGDLVRAVVRYRDLRLIDGYVRIYKMQFDIDANQLETLTPTMIPE